MQNLEMALGAKEEEVNGMSIKADKQRLFCTGRLLAWH